MPPTPRPAWPRGWRPWTANRTSSRWSTSGWATATVSTCLAHCRKNYPATAVIMITGYGTVEAAVEAIRLGAFDFLTKPLIDEELLMAIERALNQQKVIEENKTLKAQLDMRFGMENIVGHDHRMLKMFDVIDAVADTRATVLITGESGTGKSLVARAIHRRSGRRDQPFVEIACGALPETLLESELFGHAAGAFTGAIGEKLGKFMLADEGTIFLDEISTASPAMQVKLLRVLQDLEFEQVGGTKTFHVDTRVILATNDDLSRLVAEGRFRQDLFYRINVINVELPPLRDRHLRHSAVGRALSAAGVRGLGQDRPRLHRRRPGRAATLSLAGQRPRVAERDRAGRVVGQGGRDRRGRFAAVAAGGRRRSTSSRPPAARLKQALESPERQIIREVLESHNWNRNDTAEALGINRTTLYKKMKRLGLEDLALAMGR